MKKRYLYFIILGFCILFSHVFYFVNTLFVKYTEIRRMEIIENEKIKEENIALQNRMKLKEEFEKKIMVIEQNRPAIGGDLWEIYEAILEDRVDGLEERIEGLPDTQEMIRHTERVKRCGLSLYKWTMTDFHYPTTTNSFITSEYGKNYIWLFNKQTKKYYAYRRTHRGVDIDAEDDLSVYPTYNGKVICVVENDSQFGNAVIILHEYGGEYYVSLYAHLNDVFVEKGDDVISVVDENGEPDPNKSTVIGFIGNKGFSTGRHLHFELWKWGGKRDGWVTFNPFRDSLHGGRVYENNYKSYGITFLRKKKIKINGEIVY